MKNLCDTEHHRSKQRIHIISFEPISKRSASNAFYEISMTSVSTGVIGFFFLVGNGLSEPYVRVSKLMNICEKERKFDKESFQLLCIIFLNLDHYYTTIFVKTILYTTLLNIILDTKT